MWLISVCASDGCAVPPSPEASSPSSVTLFFAQVERTINCSVRSDFGTASELTSVTWSLLNTTTGNFDILPIGTAGEERVSFATISLSADVILASLRFRFVADEDAGLYQCRGESAGGVSVDNTTLMVNRK